MLESGGPQIQYDQCPFKKGHMGKTEAGMGGRWGGWVGTED